MNANVNGLGRLEKVDLRTIWLNEAGDFTPWLAREENLCLLSEAIGLDLECEGQEREVGRFRADILCKDTATDSLVLIENQLERTNHSHLGQLLTYAAGLHAVTIVWIAERITEEHRAALDWLNEITGEQFNFFGLEIELWRIGSSALAPKFNVVSRPNDWSKAISGAALAGELTTTKQLQLEYWQQFCDVVESRESRIRARNPRPQHWMTFAIGRSGFQLFAVLNTRDRRVGVGLSMHTTNAKAQFRALALDRSSIDAALGENIVEWMELPEKKESKIVVHKSIDPADREHWPRINDWFCTTLELFVEVFSSRVKQLGRYLEVETAVE